MISDEASRRYRAPAKVLGDELGRVVWSTLGRALPISLGTVFIAGVGAGYFGMTDAIGEGDPITTLFAGGVVVVTIGAVFGITLWRVLDGSRGDVLDVVAWTAREAQQEWAVASPGSRPPRSPDQARRWLAAHDETDANRPQRLAASLLAGDLAGARQTLERYPVGTVIERHRRAADGIGIDIIAGRTVSDEEIGAAYAELGSEHQAHAATCRAMTEALAAVLSGADWRAPLVRARSGLPAEAAGRGRRQIWFLLLGGIVGTSGLLIGTTAVLWTLTR